ncbi:MAG TPA: IS1595 family transposase [Chitinophagaceae bacterium]|nr:IS1595 family transposase [Chitinophagaceae bacterium]
MKAFKSLLEFQKHFSTDEKCREFLEQGRWGNTPACCFCGSTNVKRLKDGKRFQCNEKECRKQFSATVGTMYENTKIPLTKWFLAMYILSNHSKGISSLQLASWLGVTQRTAWFLNHRIRVMLTENQPELLTGIVEVDETFVGGKISNKHVSKRKGLNRNSNKTMVFGAVQRGGKVSTQIVDNTKAESLVAAIKNNVREGSTMVSDENVGYHSVKSLYNHLQVNHSKEEYVKGIAHTNTIEGFWNLLKKQINGIHHSVSPKHLQRYCNEAAYRYNRKSKGQDERFADILTNCEGRLKYKELTGKQ